MAPIIDNTIRPLPGHTVRFRDIHGRGERQGEIIDASVSPWSGRTTFVVRVNMSGDWNVPATRVEGVVRYL